jgi:hypothetical protein
MNQFGSLVPHPFRTAAIEYRDKIKEKRFFLKNLPVCDLLRPFFTGSGIDNMYNPAVDHLENESFNP